EGVRTLRADGPGWSLVARTGDAAFVLLDEEPGGVLAVPREGVDGLPGLSALLAALDQAAVRPV
ncbi:membrane protein, partial [Streptomyces sp. RSD-27]